MISHTIDHFILDPKSKQDNVTHLKNLTKLQICPVVTKSLQATHLKLLDTMCKYDMDPASIIEDTERTWFCPQTDKVKPVYPLSTNYFDVDVLERQDSIETEVNLLIKDQIIGVFSWYDDIMINLQQSFWECRNLVFVSWNNSFYNYTSNVKKNENKHSTLQPNINCLIGYC